MNGSIVDYLRAIEDLEENGVPLRNGTLVDALRVTPASVSQMMRRLREKGLVEEAHPGPLRLTDAGRRVARRATRRHRLLETWLVESLSLDWTAAHEEAHELEHAVSERLEEVLDAHLGRPSRDPHGAPIPDAEGAVAGEGLTPLAALADGQCGVVARLRERDEQRLAYWASVGLVLGVPVRRVAAAPFGGPIRMEVGGRTAHLGRAALDGIWVRLEEDVRESD